MNWALIIAAAGVIVTIVGATAKLVAAWGAAAHQLAELRDTMAKMLGRVGELESWRMATTAVEQERERVRSRTAAGGVAVHVNE